MRKILLASILSAILSAWLGCAPSPTGEESAEELRGLLARSAAHADIDEWEPALELLDQARSISPKEQAVPYGVAVVSFLSGDPAAAHAALAEISDVPPELESRIRFLEARLAYEQGDLESERIAYRRAAELVPTDPIYRFSLAEMELRDPNAEPEARGEPLAKALELWPENIRIASEYVHWALENEDAAAFDHALDVLEKLAEESGSDQVRALFEKGQQQVRDGERPIALRQSLNLLRATKRYRSDAAELEAALQPRLSKEPVLPAPLAEQASPKISWVEDEMLPSVPGSLRLMIRLDDAVVAPEAAKREATLVALCDEGIFVLGRIADSFEAIEETVGSTEITTGDLDGDGRQEIILLDERGLRVLGRDEGSEVFVLRTTIDALAGSRMPLILDWEQDGDLDILSSNAEHRLELTLHRGEAGLGQPEPAALANQGPVTDLLATDIDGDRDRDLVLLTGGQLEVWRNWGQGEYGLSGRWDLGFSASGLLALEANGDGFGDVLVLGGTGAELWRGDSRGRLLSISTPIAVAENSAAAVVDVDLDGNVDVVLSPVDASPVLFLNPGDGSWHSDTDAEGSAGDRAGILSLDLDGDDDADLLTWRDGELSSFRNEGPEQQNRITIALRAPKRKVPRDGWGAHLEVVTGRGRRFYELDRPEMVVGLGSSEVSFIRATWPNGISEYLFAPASRERHEIELTLRVEGSCPFLYASNGREMQFITDILGMAPLGMLAAPGAYVAADPEEYLRLSDWVAPVDGRIELWITEELREVAYLDQVELVAVDAPEEWAVHNGEQWRLSPIEGLALRPLADLQAPASVISEDGRDVLDIVLREDHRYLTNHLGEPRYQGAVALHSLEIELPVEIASSKHPALLFVGWLHWGNTSTNVARSQDPDGAPVFPYLEVPDGKGGWRRVEGEAGLPAGKTKPVILDLSGIVDPDDPRVRLTTDFEVYWDLVAAGRLVGEQETQPLVHRLAPSRAELEFAGFSRWYRPAENGPYLFDASEFRSIPWRLDSNGSEVMLAWSELEGYLTEFGEVSDLLAAIDERMVVFGSGERLRASFTVASLPPLAEGWRRTYFLHNEGWERDGDPNVSCRSTVEPLPRRESSLDPCADSVLASTDLDRRESRRTRWVSGDRLIERAEASISENTGPTRDRP